MNINVNYATCVVNSVWHMNGYNYALFTELGMWFFIGSRTEPFRALKSLTYNITFVPMFYGGLK